MDPEAVNEVRLVGRVSAVLDERVLPSGDTVVPLRLVVARAARPGATTSGRSKATVDVIDVACWSAATRRVAARLEPGDSVTVDGALHRRFFRGGAGVQSRYEVAAGRLTRTPRPSPRSERLADAARASEADNGVR